MNKFIKNGIIVYFVLLFIINMLFEVDLRDLLSSIKPLIMEIYDIFLKHRLNSFSQYFNISRLIADIEKLLLPYKKDVLKRDEVVVIEKVPSMWESFWGSIIETIGIKEDDTYLSAGFKIWLKGGPAFLFMGYVVLVYYIRPPGSDE